MCCVSALKINFHCTPLATFLKAIHNQKPPAIVYKAL